MLKNSIIAKLLRQHKKLFLQESEEDYIALDTETTGLDLQHGCKPFFVGICDSKGNTRSWEWSVNPKTREPKVRKKDLEELRGKLANKIIIFQHAKFDIRALETVGFKLHFRYPKLTSKPTNTVVSTACSTFHDTGPLSHVFDSSGPRGLKDLAILHLDYKDTDEKKLKDQVAIAGRKAKQLGIPYTKGQNLKGERQTAYDYWLPQALREWCFHKGISIPEGLEENHLEEYGTQDPERTMLLWILFKAWLQEDDTDTDYLKLYLREKLYIPILYRKQEIGISCRTSRANKVKKELEAYRDKHKKIAETIANKKLGSDGFNIQSSIDMQKLLYSKEGFQFKTKKKTKTGYSTDKDTLEKLLEVEKSVTKKKFLYSTLLCRTSQSSLNYLHSYNCYKIPTEHRGYWKIYPSINAQGTKTTRASSSNPNGQNISKLSKREIVDKTFLMPSLRSVFCPCPGKLWYAIDYSQLELRIFAVAANDKKLQEAFASGADIHAYVAQQMFGCKEPTKQQRFAAKAVSFGVIYGSAESSIDARAGFKGAYQLFIKQFPRMQSFKKEMVAFAKKHGYVKTLFGYKLWIDPGRENTTVINYICQGTAGDILKNATIMLQEKGLINWVDSFALIQIHDELIIEVDKSNKTTGRKWLKNVMKCMQQAGKDIGVITPVTVKKITTSWAEGKELSISV